MPLTFTASASSRVSKLRGRKPASHRRAATFPLFSGAARRKPTQRSKPKLNVDDEEDFFGDRLGDTGLVATLATDLTLRDVAQYMTYSRAHMFDPFPERAGMNNTRLAEVMSFRKLLPPIVTNPHIHALMSSPTVAEREINELVVAGVLRKIMVPGRGVGTSSISEGMVLVKDWVDLVKEGSKTVPEEVKSKYIFYLESNTQASKIWPTTFTIEESGILVQAGLLTTFTSPDTKICFTKSTNSSLGNMTSIASISKAASGSLAAVGGEGVINSGGGGPAGLQDNTSHNPSAKNSFTGQNFQLSLPNTGSFLRLVSSARSHLLQLLSRSKYNEAPVDLLRERWNGGVVTGHRTARSKEPFGDLLPGKTKKWKEFYGLNFDWALAECVGAGLVEVFETGSVGRGVRAI